MINGRFAADARGGIGFNGTLPWPKNKEDMEKFAEITTGHVVVMGRRTFDDPKMPKPLTGRTNYVFTNRPITIPGIRTLRGSVIENLRNVQEIHAGKNIYVIGGKELIEEASILFENLYLTHIKGQYRSDTRINLDRFLLGFRATSACPSIDRSCTFMIYKNVLK